jgi:predicted small metal-binding protein
MKRLRCEEAGLGRECNWEFFGETEEEVLRKAREHGKKMHNRQREDAQLRPSIREV